MKSAKKVETVVLPEFDYRTIELSIEGMSPLIMHKFSEKAKKEIEDKQQKKAKKGRDARDPKAEYLGALHLCEDGKPGFPAAGVKKAMVRAAKNLGMIMKDMMTSFHIIAHDPSQDLIKIVGKHEMRTDFVRLNGSSADIRYRPEFKKWSANVIVEYNAAVVSAEQLTAMLEVAGRGVGLGDWRVEKGGGYGRFKIV